MCSKYRRRVWLKLLDGDCFVEDDVDNMRGKSAPADVRIRGVASSISGFNMRAPCALRTTKHHIEYIVLVLICLFVFHLCSQHLKGLCNVHVCERVRATGVPTTPQCEHWKQLIELDWSSVPIFVFALLLAFCACTVCMYTVWYLTNNGSA